MKISERINDYLKLNELSARDMAKKCNVSHQYICNVINGQMDNPSVAVAAKLCKVFDWNLKEFKTMVPNKDDYYYSKLENKLYYVYADILNCDEAIKRYVENNTSYEEYQIEFETISNTFESSLGYDASISIDDHVSYQFYYIPFRRIPVDSIYSNSYISDIISKIVIVANHYTYCSNVFITSSKKIYDAVCEAFSRSQLYSKDSYIELYYDCKNRKKKESTYLIHPKFD